ncbi:DUF5908 family protein [Hufsiella arboris]|uniref:DUF5908 family protein n=1 Tax=Hufsiella arboris TaxID=2695275 RepID=UPI001925419A|nr:DUF5908 family protein [Hufsiella arboris]
MPLIIQEIAISVTVADNNPAGGSSTANPSTKEEIIKECVEQVMEIIKQKNER